MMLRRTKHSKSSLRWKEAPEGNLRGNLGAISVVISTHNLGGNLGGNLGASLGAPGIEQSEGNLRGNLGAISGLVSAHLALSSPSLLASDARKQASTSATSSGGKECRCWCTERTIACSPVIQTR
jgi:hypothetical protein